jgi:hypothetical protein
MATLDLWGILQLINDEFPQYLPLLQKPGVFDVFSRYAQAKSGGGNPWTPDQLLAEYHKTEYYQSSTDQMRQWDLLQATDPASAAQKRDMAARMISDAQKATGIVLSQDGGLSSMYFSFLVDAVRNNWDATEIKYRLLGSVNTTPTLGGELGQKAADVRRMANDYGLPMSDEKVMAYGRGMLQGAFTPETLQGDLILQAKSLYPTIAGQLDKGMTVRQFADPYLQLAQRELGIDPNSVDLTDSKWIKMLNQQDPKTGDRTPMTVDTWLSTIRSDPTYGYAHTSQGKQSASTLAAQLGQKMGASA